MKGAHDNAPVIWMRPAKDKCRSGGGAASPSPSSASRAWSVRCEAWSSVRLCRPPRRATAASPAPSRRELEAKSSEVNEDFPAEAWGNRHVAGSRVSVSKQGMSACNTHDTGRGTYRPPAAAPTLHRRACSSRRCAKFASCSNARSLTGRWQPCRSLRGHSS